MSSDESDLRIEAFTNTAECSWRIMHLPTGLVAEASGRRDEYLALKRAAMADLERKVTATKTIPLDAPDETAGRLLQAIFAAPEHRDGPPFTHTLKLPETEEEMRAEMEAPMFTVEDGP